MGSIRQGLIIMAKQPIPGQVKTRLCPPLTPEEAAEFASTFLSDSVASAKQANCAEVVLAYSPATARDWFAERFPGIALIPQQGNDLGERLKNVLDAAWKLRYQPCVVIGTDSPDLPNTYLQEAFEALRPGSESHDLVLGPSEDGGYYLIGLKWRHPELFTEITWSTNQVLEQTLQRANSLHLRVHLLPTWQDVDTFADLQALQARLSVKR